MTSILKVDSIQTAAGKPILNSSGSVLQVLSTVKTDTFSSSSTSLTDITGLSVTITPSSASSKILVIVNCAVTGADAGIGFSIVRGSTEIYLGDAAGSRQRFSMVGFYGTSSPTQYAAGSNHACFLDSPTTTSATTYKLQGKTRSGAFYIGRTYYDLDNDNASRMPSSITVMEIAG
jgi:hypothetical protein